jgi:dTDP-4-dehydrorhamnose reductase
VLAKEELLLWDRPDFDLLSEEIEDRVRAAHPDVVIHAAAYTDVDGAERDQARAMAVNAKGTERVARGAAAAKARLIYLSTDYVFDGEKPGPYVESDQPHPLSVYGRSKLEGERLALARCEDTLVIRTSWLYGATGKNFVKTIARLAAEKPELRVVSDQRGSPTYAWDLALALKKVLGVEVRGIAHATGSGACTWHEFASAIVKTIGLSTPVVPITTVEAARLAARPKNSVLANTVLARHGVVLPPWQESLERFLSSAPALLAANG